MDEVCKLGEERVLIQMDDAPDNRKFRDLICVLLEGLGEFQDVARAITAAFDVETAEGEQLDFIGSVVGLPRQGYTDDRYRTFIQIQIDLIQTARQEGANWTGTHNNLLRIIRTFIGDGPDPIVLSNFPPYSFTVTIPGIVLSEMQILINFLCVALYAGVLGQTIFTLAPSSLWDSASVGPITDGGIWCSDSVPVVPCAVWGFTVQIGSQNCG